MCMQASNFYTALIFAQPVVALELYPNNLQQLVATWRTFLEAGDHEYRIRARRPEDQDWSVEYDGTTHVVAAFSAGATADAAPLAKARCSSKVGAAYASRGGAGARIVVIATDDGGSDFFPGSVAVFCGGELVASELTSPGVPVSVADDGRSVAFASKYGKSIVSLVRAADGRWDRRTLPIPRDDYARLAACEGGVLVLREFRYGLFRPAPEDGELERNFVVDRYRCATGPKTTHTIPRHHGSLLADMDGERLLVAEPSRTEHPYDLALYELDGPRKPRRHAGLGAAFCERARIRPGVMDEVDESYESSVVRTVVTNGASVYVCDHPGSVSQGYSCLIDRASISAADPAWSVYSVNRYGYTYPFSAVAPVQNVGYCAYSGYRIAANWGASVPSTIYARVTPGCGALPELTETAYKANGRGCPVANRWEYGGTLSSCASRQDRALALEWIPLDAEREARVCSAGASVSVLSFHDVATGAELDPASIGASVVDESAGGSIVPCYPSRSFLLFALSRYRLEIDGTPRVVFAPAQQASMIHIKNKLHFT
eukprot:tig00000430_g601.t1